ncbi:Immunoglobulin lambda-1 light chain [Anabarilius grahami]|nr:Immunoglobulin lambda-1 light chain [Anabarilius grahami]
MNVLDANEKKVSMKIMTQKKSAVLGVTLEQGQQTLVKAVGKTSYLPCKVTDLQSWNYIHWYQKRKGEAPSRLLYISAGGSFTHDPNNPQANDFTVDRTQLYNLKLSNTKPIHAAVYYCAYWDTSNHSVEGLSLKQPQKVLIKVKGKTVSFKCEVTGLGSGGFVHWYHKKVGGTFKRLLYMTESGVITSEAKEFASEKTGNSYGIKLKEIKEEHAGMYYCASWDGSHMDGAGELQQKISLTKAEDKLAIIDCQVHLNCWDYIHWYQQKEGEPLKRILYVKINDGSAKNDAGFESIKSEKKASNHFALKITKLKKEHSAMYYCACWKSSDTQMKTEALQTLPAIMSLQMQLRFLFLINILCIDQGKDKVIPPKVSAYLPSGKTSGKQAMLCHASGMFPDLVTFTWKKKSNAGDWTDVSKDDVVEQSISENSIVTSVTSMMIVDKNTAGDNLYKCSVNHEGGTAHDGIELKKDNKESAKESNKLDPTCLPTTDDTEDNLNTQISGE